QSDANGKVDDELRNRARTKTAGEVQPPSMPLTSPAPPGRSVCAPVAMSLSILSQTEDLVMTRQWFQRTAILGRSAMSLASWLGPSPRVSQTHSPTQPRRHAKLHVETLEDRCMPTASLLDVSLINVRPPHPGPPEHGTPRLIVSSSAELEKALL